MDSTTFLDGTPPDHPHGGSAEEKTSRRELNKQATRAAIIEAAVSLLSENGLGNFTAEDLADAVGISRRTFFNYFPSPRDRSVTRMPSSA
ncbi:TetR/AcrR family transcriptional regulator [Bacillus cereus]|nr:TetR/AcrR family transcriptional regulator [Bacillus cereus]